MNESICELVRTAENDYISGVTTISKYVEFSQHENIEKIDAYINSKHISGDVDSMGREKPFFNIVTSARNIWYRATDIDRKDIKIKATKEKDYVGALMATALLQDWMRKAKFGVFLNDWGRALATYGSVPVKFINKGGEMYCETVSWNRMISDTVDFENNPKIEKLYLTPAQLRKNKSYDQDIVEDLLDALQARETDDGQRKDNKSDYIELYEVHGELPKSLLTENEYDENVYTQQMHVVSFVAGEDGEYEDFTLYKGRESKDPYILTHLIKEDGRAQGIGAVEHLFEAQWMMNHTAKAIKDQLDLASKLIFQTADGNFVGRNALTSIETGDILIHKQDNPLTQINNGSHDITSLQNFAAQWKTLAMEITSTPEAIQGATMPSGTAWRQVEALRQEAHSLFEMMTENKGLAIEEMMRTYIIPFLKTQMNNSDEIAALLDENSIKQIDSRFIKNEAIKRSNKKIKDLVLQGVEAIGAVNPENQAADIEAETNNLKQGLASYGNQRFLKPSDIPTKTWKEVLKDLEWDLEIEVTGETSDKEAIFTSLTTVLQTIGNNPNVLNDPRMNLVFNKILSATGEISPLELGQAESAAMAMPKEAVLPAEKQPVPA